MTWEQVSWETQKTGGPLQDPQMVRSRFKLGGQVVVSRLVRLRRDRD